MSGADDLLRRIAEAEELQWRLSKARPEEPGPDDHRTGCGCPAHGPPRTDPMTFEDQETHQLRNDLREAEAQIKNHQIELSRYQHDARTLIAELLDHQADLVKYAEVKERARRFIGRP